MTEQLKEHNIKKNSRRPLEHLNTPDRLFKLEYKKKNNNQEEHKMTESNNIINLKAFENEATFRRIILMKSSEGGLLRLINEYLLAHKSCGRILQEYYSCRTFAGVPLIQDIDKTISFTSAESKGEISLIEHFNEFISFNGEIPIATELMNMSDGLKILVHEIVVGKINLRSIIDKYKDTWNLLDFPLILLGNLVTFQS